MRVWAGAVRAGAPVGRRTLRSSARVLPGIALEVVWPEEDFMTRPADSTETKSDRAPKASQKPSGEVGHERPTDDPGRGQGDVFDDKLPPESTTERPSR